MCYAKVDGGYRCMPPKVLLNAYRGMPINSYTRSTPSGAFWIKNNEPVQHLEEIKEEAYGLRLGLEQFTLDAAEYETEVAHLGNMIARYSDAQVEDFDRRLRHAQSLLFSYRAYISNPSSLSRLDGIKLREKLIDTNLSLGYEVRSKLRETMEEILSFKDPLNINVKGDPQLASMLYSASKFFPSTWNQTLESTLKLDFVSQGDASWYKPRYNSMQITEGGENFSSYHSMDAARAASILNKRQYETQVEMVHELSHKFESVESRIGKVGRSFLERRALPNQEYYLDGARYERDHFASYYIGRNYNSEIHTEIFSMGMESTFLGTNGSLIGLALPQSEKPNSQIFINRPDIEHRNLTIGIVAGLAPSFNQDTMGKPIKTVFAYDPNDTISI